MFGNWKVKTVDLGTIEIFLQTSHMEVGTMLYTQMPFLRGSEVGEGKELLEGVRKAGLRDIANKA